MNKQGGRDRNSGSLLRQYSHTQLNSLSSTGKNTSMLGKEALELEVTLSRWRRESRICKKKQTKNVSKNSKQ